MKLDGEPMGVIGIAREAGATRFFSEYRLELKPYLSTITAWRAITAVMSWVRNQAGPVYAISEHEEGERLMKRLGFERVDGNVWRL